MNLLSNLLERINKFGLIAGGTVIVFGMLLLTGNILGRVAHFVIPGSYEMFELMMAIPVSFALFFTALRKGHVTVNLVISKFPDKVAAVLEIINSLACIATWMLVAYAVGTIVSENGWGEMTVVIELPFLPFRIIFILCLCLFSLTYVMDIIESVRRLIKK